MVNIISFLRSIRIRLILVVILVVSALLFQNLFLVSTQDLQTSFENEGDEYLEIDNQILGQLNNLDQITDTMETEHVATLIGDLLFNEEVNITEGQDTFGDFSNKLIEILTALSERQDQGYFIESQLDNALIEATGLFQNQVFDQEVIDTTATGISSLFSEYNASLTVDKEEIRVSDVDGTLFYTGNIFAINLIEEATISLEAIRRAHNVKIQGARGNFENTTGFISIISARIDDALSRLTNDLDPDELNRKLNMLELFRQISEYVSLVSRFEKLNIARENVKQNVVEAEIEEFTVEIDSRALNISDLTALVRAENQLDGTILLSMGFIDIAFDRVHIQVGNALNFSSINLGRIIEDTRNMIETMRVGLTEEQTLFQIEFNKLLDDLDNDLRVQTQTVSAIIIILIFLLLGQTAFVLVRYFNRYEKNYLLIGEGKLNIPAQIKYSDDEIGRLNFGFDNMMSELKRVLVALQRSSERMAGIAEELAAGSEEASASVQEVSNTVREFSAGAAEQNLMLNRIDEKLTDHLKTIEEATSQINETSNFVLKVAKRTNILGLNASIEAAKAGKFGLGFNVVAEEVRNLSSDTKTSALEIADLIEVIETKIQTTIREIQQEVNITKDVAENTAAGSEEANAATSEQVVMLNEISQTSNELSLLANELQELLSRFDLA